MVPTLQRSWNNYSISRLFASLGNSLLYVSSWKWLGRANFLLRQIGIWPIDVNVGCGNGRFQWSRVILIEFGDVTHWKKKPTNNIQYLNFMSWCTWTGTYQPVRTHLNLQEFWEPIIKHSHYLKTTSYKFAVKLIIKNRVINSQNLALSNHFIIFYTLEVFISVWRKCYVMVCCCTPVPNLKFSNVILVTRNERIYTLEIGKLQVGAPLQNLELVVKICQHSTDSISSISDTGIDGHWEGKKKE